MNSDKIISTIAPDAHKWSIGDWRRWRKQHGLSKQEMRNIRASAIMGSPNTDNVSRKRLKEIENAQSMVWNKPNLYEEGVNNSINNVINQDLAKPVANIQPISYQEEFETEPLPLNTSPIDTPSIDTPQIKPTKYNWGNNVNSFWQKRNEEVLNALSDEDRMHIAGEDGVIDYNEALKWQQSIGAGNDGKFGSNVGNIVNKKFGVNLGNFVNPANRTHTKKVDKEIPESLETESLETKPEKNSFFTNLTQDPRVKVLGNILTGLGGFTTTLLAPATIVGPARALYDNLNRFWKQGSHITKHQQGGTVNEQEQIIRQVIQGINQGDPQIMQALSSLDEQQQQAILQSIAQLAQQGDQEAANAISKIQNPQTAKLGTKLSYIKRLKGVCPEGTEKIYLKSGGCMCQKVTKAQEGDTLKIKQNPVQEFKTKTKKKKLDPATTKTLPKGGYPDNWTAADRAKWEEIHGNHGDIPEDFDANGGHKGEKWTPKKACGSKFRK